MWELLGTGGSRIVLVCLELLPKKLFTLGTRPGKSTLPPMKVEEMSVMYQSQDSSWKASVSGPVHILSYALKQQGRLRKQVRFYRRLCGSRQAVKGNESLFQVASEIMTDKQPVQAVLKLKN